MFEEVKIFQSDTDRQALSFEQGMPNMQFGELWLSEGVISAAHFKQALAQGCTNDEALYEWIADREIATEKQLLQVLSNALFLGLYDPKEYRPDPSVSALISEDVARTEHIMPVKQTAERLVVIVRAIPHEKAVSTLELTEAREVVPLLATRADYDEALRLVYGSSRATPQFMEGFNKGDFEGAAAPVMPSGSTEVIRTGDASEEAPIIELVNRIMVEGVRLGASDIHITPEREAVCVRYRKEGLLTNPTSVAQALGPALVSRIKIVGGMDISITRMPQDGRFTVNIDGRDINVRVSTLPTTYGENIVMRLLDMSANRLYDLKSMGMREADYNIVTSCARRPHGMILSTGPTGSGKSTTLYSILNLINRPEVNIITLEDPVEYRMDGVRQVELNTRAGMTFASGLRSILRQDPDILMVGEIRDRETASIAVQAALTGHLVLSTLHTNDALGAIYRLKDMGVEGYLISSVLLCTFAQRLVRTICPHCKKPYKPNEGLLLKFGLNPQDTYYHGEGCPHCNGTGYLGRIGVYEVVPVSEQIQELINQDASEQQLTLASMREGLHTMQQDLAEKIRAGLTTVQEAARVTML